MSRSSLLQRPDRILIVGTSKKKFGGGGGGDQWKPLFKLIVKGELRLCIAARLNCHCSPHNPIDFMWTID